MKQEAKIELVNFCKSCQQKAGIRIQRIKKDEKTLETMFECSECGAKSWKDEELFETMTAKEYEDRKGREKEKTGSQCQEETSTGEPESLTEEKEEVEATKDTTKEDRGLKKDLKEEEEDGLKMVMEMPLGIYHYTILKHLHETQKGGLFYLELPVISKGPGSVTEYRKIADIVSKGKRAHLRYRAYDDKGKEIGMVWLGVDSMDPFPHADHVCYDMTGVVEKVVDFGEEGTQWVKEYKNTVDGRIPVMIRARQLGKAMGTKFNEWVRDYKIASEDLHKPFVDREKATEEPRPYKLAEPYMKDLKQQIDEGAREMMDYMEKMEKRIQLEKVNHPGHYQLGDLGIEATDIMEAIMTPEQMTGWRLGNVIKYILRAEKKNGLEDYKKARFYLDELIKMKEQEGDGE